MWLENKDDILLLFTQVERDGQALLTHGRVERDWERLLDKRDELSEKQRTRAQKRWGKEKESKQDQEDATACQPHASRMPAVCRTMPDDAKGSEVKVR